IHAASNMLSHRLTATVVNKDTRIVGMKLPAFTVARTNVGELVQHINLRCMKVHRVTITVVRMVMEGKLHQITLFDTDNRPWNRAIIGPQATGVAGIIDRNIDILRRHYYLG